MGVERQQGSAKQLDLFDEALKASLRHDVTGKGGTGAGTSEERQTPTAWTEKFALACDVTGPGVKQGTGTATIVRRPSGSRRPGMARMGAGSVG